MRLLNSNYRKLIPLSKSLIAKKPKCRQSIDVIVSKGNFLKTIDCDNIAKYMFTSRSKNVKNYVYTYGFYLCEKHKHCKTTTSKKSLLKYAVAMNFRTPKEKKLSNHIRKTIVLPSKKKFREMCGYDKRLNY